MSMGHVCCTDYIPRGEVEKEKGVSAEALIFLAFGYGSALVKDKTGEQQPIFVNKKPENTYYSTKNNAFFVFFGKMNS